MAIANALAQWQKIGTQVALETSVSAGGSIDYELHDETEGLIVDPNRAVVERSLSAGGGPQRKSHNHVLGRPRPVGTLRLPLTPINLAIAFQSLLQDTNHDGAKYVLGAYSTPATSKWLYAETGIAGAQTVTECYGGRVTRITIDIPAPTDDDPGNPMLVCDVIWCNAARVDAFTGSPAVTDTAEPYTSLDLSLAAGGASNLFLKGQIVFDIGATKSREVNTPTPIQIFANRLNITGSVTAYASTSDTDIHDDLIDAHDSKTDIEVGLTIEAGATDHTIVFDALVEAPNVEDEDGMMAMTFGLKNVDDNDDQPTVTIVTADMSW